MKNNSIFTQPYAVLDTETTGLGDDAAICEIALMLVYPTHYADPFDPDGTGYNSACALITPGLHTEIEPEAMAVHHITPELLDASRAEAIGDFMQDGKVARILSEATYLVAHNAAHDMKYVDPELKDAGLQPLPWVCSMRLVQHLWRDLPSYKNGAVAYRLGLMPPLFRQSGAMLHSAMTDVRVTARVMHHCLGTLAQRIADGQIPPIDTLDELIAYTLSPMLLPFLPFGKFRGVPMAEVETGYLDWILQKQHDPEYSFTPDVIATVAEERSKRGIRG